MNVINIQQLKVIIGVRNLLNLKNLQIQNGQKIGIVGKNGSGKTTFFKALLGKIEVEVANFTINGTTAMLPQLKQTNTYKSGGEVSQDYIIRILNQSPNILLADEPTANLDTSHVEWVEDNLKEFHGTLLLISHDRTLLDNVCDTIWELESGEIREYRGNYSSYLEQKQNEEKYQQKEYLKYQTKRKQLEEAIHQKKEQAQQAGKVPKNKSYSEINAKGAKDYYGGLQKGLYQNQKALETRLEKLKVIDKPSERTPIKMDLPDVQTYRNKIILRAENLEGQVGQKKLWNPTTFFIRGGDKVGVIGPNGSGKTTLVRKILSNNSSNIYRSPAMKIGYFAQDLNILNTNKTILENVKEDSKQNETLIRTILARLGFYQNDVNKNIRVLSGGERVKVSLAKIFVSDSNTLILDEPTNFLDIYTLEILKELLLDYEGTLMIITHDRDFISSVATKILAFEEQELIFFDGNYEKYLNRDTKNKQDFHADELARIDNELTAVLSQLSIEGTRELEEKYQELIRRKREIEK